MWKDLEDSGWIKHIGNDAAKAISNMYEDNKLEADKMYYGNGDASQVIVDTLRKVFD